MPRPTKSRDPVDVITIVRDEDVLDRIEIVYDENDDPVVKVTLLVPDKDGTLRRETRVSSVSPTGFITSAFNDVTTP